jgi:hypothetical protein
VVFPLRQHYIAMQQISLLNAHHADKQSFVHKAGNRADPYKSTSDYDQIIGVDYSDLVVSYLILFINLVSNCNAFKFDSMIRKVASIVFKDGAWRETPSKYHSNFKNFNVNVFPRWQP